MFSCSKSKVLITAFCVAVVVPAPSFAATGRIDDLAPKLMRLIHKIEKHYGGTVEVTSGCRSNSHNRRVHGARESWHLQCEAADIKIKGVDKEDLADYAIDMRDRGGVGLYCHDESVHIDLGPKREWRWGCHGERKFHQRLAGQDVSYVRKHGVTKYKVASRQ